MRKICYPFGMAMNFSKYRTKAVATSAAIPAAPERKV
jgi:hypothetical protein